MGLICSTSDDRSAMLWSTNNLSLNQVLLESCPSFKLLCVVYGHTARVFRCRVLSECFLTTGEDSVVNVWDFKGNPIRKIETHQSDAVWALDYDETSDYLITGGGDSAVTLTKLNQRTSTKQLKLENNTKPKRLCLLKSGNLAITSQKGELYYYNIKNNNCILKHSYEDMKDYAVVDVSPCRRLLALAGKDMSGLGVEIVIETNILPNRLVRYSINSR